MKKTRAVLLSSSLAVGVLALLMLGLFAGAVQAGRLTQDEDPVPEPIGPSTPVSGRGITPTLWGDNPNCISVGLEYAGQGWYGFKVNKAPAGTYPLDLSNGGTHTGGAPDDPANSITISNTVLSNGGQVLFDWSATLGIDAVIVKSAEDANVYVYHPTEYFWDTGLGSQPNPENPQGKPYDISHVEFCYDYEDDCGDLEVFKYLDGNQNGSHDEGEVGLEGWTISLISGTQTIATTTTDEDGYADFGCVEPGTYTVCETLESGWTNSDPGDGTLCKSVTVAAGQPQTIKFGNYQEEMGTKQGRKFHDLNGNGQDDGEPGLIDWEIHLFGARLVAGSPTYTATTNVNGDFAVQVSDGGYTICEVLKDGWTQSFPNGAPTGKDVVDCSAYSTNGYTYGPRGYYEYIEAGTVVSDNVFGNYTTALKRGQKYHDLNANGVKDGDEPGLAGWTINLDGTDGAGNPVTLLTQTDADGYYTFTVNPGSYTVTEQCPVDEGWRQSDPGPLTDEAGCGSNARPVTLNSMDNDIDNDFGNFKDAIKSGVKFHDLDANGVKDGGEPGLGGWEIKIYDESGAELGTAVTAGSGPATGTYTFTLQPGMTYTVCEVLQDGWIQSHPAAGDPGVVSCSGYDNGVTHGPLGYSINLESGEEDLDNDFGNYRRADKSGRKFEDLKADGPDAGDPGLGGWTIRAYADDGTVDGALDLGDTLVDEATTAGTTGAYNLNLDPGSYIICEVLQDGWVQSYPTDQTPNSADCSAVEGLGPWGYAIALQSTDEEMDNDFGNFQPAVKTGVKFHDIDHSGSWTDGDELLEGWTIYLDGTDGAGNPVHLETQTDANGVYTFTVPPGSYTVCEDIPDDWDQTFPTGGANVVACPEAYGGGLGYAIDFDSGESAEGNDFGNDPKMIVGGVSHPSSTLALLTPWLGLAALLGLAVSVTVMAWRRKAA